MKSERGRIKGKVLGVSVPGGVGPSSWGASQGPSQPRKATVFVVPGAQPAGTQVQAQRIFLPVSSAPLGSGAGRAWLVGIC